MKNKILAALLTVALVGTMTACGNKSEGGSTDSSNTQSSSLSLIHICVFPTASPQETEKRCRWKTIWTIW